MPILPFVPPSSLVNLRTFRLIQGFFSEKQLTFVRFQLKEFRKQNKTIGSVPEHLNDAIGWAHPVRTF